MSWEHWVVFTLFWAVFVTTPGPNAVNCISNGMVYGFGRALWGVAAILLQACLFLSLSAAGVAALIISSPEVFFWAKLAGAGVLIWLGVRGWRRAGMPARVEESPSRHVFWHGFMIATLNAKSVAGYLAAFTQFVQPEVPIAGQMTVIMPTALTLTTLSYTGYCALGAGLGRAAVGVMFRTWIRRTLAGCFIIYGLLLGSMAIPQGRG